MQYTGEVPKTFAVQQMFISLMLIKSNLKCQAGIPVSLPDRPRAFSQDYTTSNLQAGSCVSEIRVHEEEGNNVG